ncbi:GSF2 Glucose-signaling factor 2 [Candida maltosa Xu316]
MSDIEEDSELGYLDIYIRFNSDVEKDYCFQINTNTTFKDLYKIFDTIPLSLRPSVFYHAKPIGFKKSISPGYLTQDGNFVFDDDAESKTVRVKDSDLVNDHVWPGQLILPVWEFNDFGFYSFLAFLVCWLYTDLPDFISPTPGLCLTNQMTKFLCWVARLFGQDRMADIIIKDLYDPVSVGAQIAFFVFHIIKVLFLFGFLYTGLFNPIKVFRLPSRSTGLDVTKDELIKIGWTGIRKATIDEYKEYYRDCKIKQYGGMIQAHRAGLFETLKDLGVQLEEGEGFNTPMTEENKLRPMKEIIEAAKKPNFKLKVSYEYFAELGYVFGMLVDNKSGSELSALIKEHRRYGLLVASERIEKVVKGRKGKLDDEDEKIVVVEEEEEEVLVEKADN